MRTSLCFLHLIHYLYLCWLGYVLWDMYYVLWDMYYAPDVEKQGFIQQFYRRLQKNNILYIFIKLLKIISRFFFPLYCTSQVAD